MRLLHPIPAGRQTDGYGERGFVPGVGSLGFHHGQDWAAPSGTPIRAMATGSVWANYYDRRGGWMVILKHSWGYTSYQHMRAKSRLMIGQPVTVGAHVGNVGSSGASTGAHLHAEVWIDGTPYGTGRSVDPLKYINAPKPAPQTIPATGWRDEDDEMKPTIHVRTEGNPEYMRAHPDIGKSLKPGSSRKDGNVTIFRGYEVTTNATIGTAWARQYAGGAGNEHSRTDRAGYIAIQAQATRLSVAVHG